MANYSYAELANDPFAFDLYDEPEPPAMAPNWDPLPQFSTDWQDIPTDTGNPFLGGWPSFVESGRETPVESLTRLNKNSRPVTPFRKRPDLNVRKKSRFEIPAERNLSNIDELINATTDEDLIRELKQQKRLLRNRQAALDSRRRRKLHKESLEAESQRYAKRLQSSQSSKDSDHTEIISSLMRELEEARRSSSILHWSQSASEPVHSEPDASWAWVEHFWKHLEGLSENEASFNSSHFLSNKRFYKASENAYCKLFDADTYAPAELSDPREQFSHFLMPLGTHSEIVDRGFEVFKKLLNREVFSNLVDVYSFLHVAYAMSQMGSENPCRSTPADFNAGLAAFRKCLDPQPRDPDDISDYCELDVFDVIVEIMWNEIDEAMGWLGKQEGLDFLKTLEKTATKLEEARRLLVRARRLETSNEKTMYQVSDEGCGTNLQSGNSSQWLDIMTGSIFGMVIGLMRALATSTSEFLETFASAAYSFLLHPMENTSEGLQHYFAVFFDNIYNTSEDDFQKTCPSGVFQIALELLRDGAIPTLRHFESYLLWIGKLACNQQSQFASWAECVLRQCGSCAYHVSDNDENKIKPNWAEDYGIDYLTARFNEALTDYQHGIAQPFDHTLATVETFSPSNHAQPDPDVLMADEEANLPQELSSPLSNVESIQTIPDLSDGNTTPTNNTPSIETPLDSTPDSEPSETTKAGPKPKIDIKCNLEGCNKIFSTRPNLFRHQRSAHPDITVGTSKSFVCNYEGCTVTLNRKDNIYRHRSNVHGIKKKTPVYRA